MYKIVTADIHEIKPFLRVICNSLFRPQNSVEGYTSSQQHSSDIFAPV